MMSKEQKTDMVEQGATNQPVMDSEKQVAKKSSRMRAFILYFIFTVLLAVGSAIAVYYTTPIVLKSLAPQKFTIIPPPSPISDTIQTQNDTIFINEIESESQTVVEEEAAAEEEEVISAERISEPTAHLITHTDPLVFVPFQPVVSEEQQPMQMPTVTARPNSNYSILKAMELRDALKNGGECRPLLEELVAIPNKTPEMDQALMSLLQSCLERPLAGQMKEAFHAAKKRAILRIFQTKYPTYIAYFKAIPYFLANIRKKNPTGKDPLDILDLIQNAVDADRPQLVLKLIPELPANVQATLNDVTQLAQAESDLNRTLNQLMKTLFDRGE